MSAAVGALTTAVAYPAIHDDRDTSPANAHVIFRVHTTAKVVALSFDDGPDPRFTPQVLTILDRFHAHATFFVVGENVQQHPELVRAEVERGDEIGNHTFDHPDLESLPADQVAQEIARGAAAIRAAGAPAPDLFRPPRGLTDEIVAVIADANRYKTVFWDLAVEHFVNHTTTAAAVDEMIERIRPGDIILAHDGRLDRSRTVVALPYLLERLRSQGYHVVTVHQLLAAGDEANVSR